MSQKTQIIRPEDTVEESARKMGADGKKDVLGRALENAYERACKDLGVEHDPQNWDFYPDEVHRHELVEAARGACQIYDARNGSEHSEIKNKAAADAEYKSCIEKLSRAGLI